MPAKKKKRPGTKPKGRGQDWAKGKPRIRKNSQEIYRTEFGEKLYQFRHEAGLRQKDVGLATGFIRETIATWETGVAAPHADDIPILCETLGITPNQLFGWE